MNGIATVIMTSGATAKRGHCEREASGARDAENIAAAKERSTRMGPHQRRGEGGQRDGRSAAGRASLQALNGRCRVTTEAHRIEICKKLDAVHFQKGEDVIVQGEKAEGDNAAMYAILSGDVDVIVDGKDVVRSSTRLSYCWLP